MSAICGSGKIAAEIDAGQVESRLIGAADEIAHGGDTAIGKNRHFFAVDRNGTDIARLAAKAFLDLAFRGETEGRKAGNLAGFDFIEFVIAAQQQ